MNNKSLNIAIMMMCVSACGDEKGSANIQTALLPAGSETMNCVETPPAPTLCDWSGALDGLYFGDISKIEMVDFPAVLASAPDTVVSTCPSGIINQALEITVNVSDTLVGTPPPGATITFVMGHHMLDEMDPRPALHPTDGIVWGAQQAGLKVGDRIGVPIHKSPTGQFGLLGEPIFTQKVVGSVVAQDRAECQEPTAEGLVNRTLADIKSELINCSSSQESQHRRDMFETFWDGRKSWAYAAMCFEFEGSTRGCVTDADCPIKETCNSTGACE